MARPWTEIVAEKQAIRDAKLAKSYDEPPTRNPSIRAAKDIQDLSKLLEKHEVTAEAIVLDHIAR